MSAVDAGPALGDPRRQAGLTDPWPWPTAYGDQNARTAGGMFGKSADPLTDAHFPTSSSAAR